MATATTSATAQRADAVPADTDEADLTAVLLDPDTIVRDDCNAREHDREPDDDLINSVKAVGVQDPVSVRPRPDGTYGAFKGWRRTQAAQIANASAEAEGHDRRQIKAFVRADLVGRDAWTRFLSLIENHQREGMSAKDTLKAAELSLIGMDEVEQKAAARALGLKRGTGKRLGPPSSSTTPPCAARRPEGWTWNRWPPSPRSPTSPTRRTGCRGPWPGTRPPRTAGAATGTRNSPCSRPTRPTAPPARRPSPRWSRRGSPCCPPGWRTGRRTPPGCSRT
ncbi:ParB/RepB/Spo0J family partition protein [Streptomyces sp. NPDC049541]|uniref:ParB/RepB/Spo0J family partition protein n=1 Tax=Streptomyces sp. NPDC049541 TaxID=3365594 RepID=UPI0037BB2F23